MNLEIQGKKIKLQLTNLSDIEKIIEFEKANNHYIYHYSKEKHLDLLKDDDCLHLSIKKLDTDSLVGHILIFGLQNPNKSLEFKRIAINEKGSGYGREAVRLIKKICFEKLYFHRLWLDVFDDNERAIGLYESEGFMKEGTLRDNIKSGTGYRSLRVYSILEDEYKKNINLDL